MMATTYVPIESVTLASSAASVTFSSIPQTYTDLVVRFTARGDQNLGYDMMSLRFNGLSTTLYSDTYTVGTGSTVASTRDANVGSILSAVFDDSGSTANSYGSAEIYIANYAASSYKPISANSAQETNSTTSRLWMTAGLWRNTAAITQITLYSEFGSNLIAGSTFHLYGIKNS